MTICVEINIRQLSNDRRNEFISFCSRFPKFFRIDVKVLEQPFIKGAVAKFTEFQRVLPAPLLLVNLRENCF